MKRCEFGHQQTAIGGALIESASQPSPQIATCPADGKHDCIQPQKRAQVDAAVPHQKRACAKDSSSASNCSLSERTQWMLKLREAVLENEHLLRCAIVYEMGKTYDAAWEDIEAVINALEWYLTP